ncbi:DUF1430 domain-containing protein [Lysinibacillus pakistanensis]|uniref:DUF1430 domain-containing protein n=1 Tax=Lysinibacillus pakistanensis TaxID=759811 RepID=UPI003D2E8DC5
MKKLIILFLCLLSVFSYYISYKQFENAEWGKNMDADSFSDFSFLIEDNDLGLSDPEVVYPIILKTAKELGVNIFRDVIFYSEGNSVETTRYVLLTTDTQLFHSLPLIKGRYLSFSETQQAEDYYLSSKEKNDQHQIGTVKVFGNHNLMNIKPLIMSYHQIPVAGEYHVESIKPMQATVFYEALATNFNEAFHPETPISGDYFMVKEIKENNPYMPTNTNTFEFVKLILAGVIALLVFYYILHQGKAIVIYKMHGVSSGAIWSLFIGKLLLLVFFIMYILLLLFSIFQEGLHTSFILKMTVQHILTFAIIVGLSVIGLFYILTIKMNTVLKNRKDTKFIVVFNILLKTTFFIISIFMISSILGQLSKIDEAKEQLANWEKSVDYGVFYPFNIGFDFEDLKKGSGSKTLAAVTKLYSTLNKEGSLLIHTKYYEQETLKEPYEGIRYISVNPNYLKKYPILSEDNKEIIVDESIKHQLLLVPHQYKDKEAEILDFFNQDYTLLIEFEKENVKAEIPKHLMEPNYHIIWTQDQQEIFSFNPEVFPNGKNIIKDPIIRVITENNSFESDRHVINGGGAKDPLKVKLVDGDPMRTYEKLKKTLKELQLDDNFKYLVTIDHLIFKELSDLKQERLLTMLVFISMMIGTIFVLIQNTILMFHNRKKLFIVRSLFGAGFFKTYRSILYILIGTWILQIAIPLIIIKTISISLVVIICVLLLIELTMLALTVIILENKNKIRVLKGGA